MKAERNETPLSIYRSLRGRLIAGASSDPGEAGLDTDPDTLERLTKAAQAALPALQGRAVVEGFAPPSLRGPFVDSHRVGPSEY